MNKGGRSIFAALLLAGAFALAGCGGDDTSSGGTGVFGAGGSGGGAGGTPPPTTTPPPTLGAGCGASGSDLICLTLTSVATSLPADGTSTSTITVTLTRNGAPLSGQIVDFSLSSATLGSLTAANGVTSAGGTATTTFQAGGTIGAVGITATHAQSSASNTLALALTQAPASTPGGIQFISATPNAVGVMGSGQPTTSAVIFRVTDPNGGPSPVQTVNFTMTGPVGAYIGPADATPTTATGTTSSTGDVTVPLNAGTAAGPVTITASVTVGGTTFTTSTSVISIGGAVPSARHFSIATSRFNLPGLVFFGATADITVFVADRFSNFNILAGTQVSFFTEAGAIDANTTLSNIGTGTAQIRTQNPAPFQVAATHPFFPNARGWVTVIAVTRGEEEFVDVNGNGVYNPGVDTFTLATMDLTEPYIDGNDNGVWDGPGCTQAGCDPTHPGEQFFDTNQNGRFDAANGVWDGPGCTQPGCTQNPTIWKAILLQFTGHPICTVTPQNGWVIPNGGLQNFTITIGDVNNNVPTPGFALSGIAMNNSSGGRTDIGTGNLGDLAMTDGISTGPFTYTFTIADNNAAATNDATGFRIDFSNPSSQIQTCLPINGAGIVQ